MRNKEIINCLPQIACALEDITEAHAVSPRENVIDPYHPSNAQAEDGKNTGIAPLWEFERDRLELLADAKGRELDPLEPLITTDETGALWIGNICCGHVRTVTLLERISKRNQQEKPTVYIDFSSPTGKNKIGSSSKSIRALQAGVHEVPKKTPKEQRRIARATRKLTKNWR